LPGGEQPEHVADDRGDLRLPRTRDHALVDELPNVVVAHHGARAGERVGDVPRDRPRVLGGADPPRGALGDAHRAEPGGDHLAREEVVLDEAAEAPADPVLALRDDRRVRDRRPSGCRKSAVIANQSAIPPTIAASASART
jgi:hypothetical protein